MSSRNQTKSDQTSRSSTRKTINASKMTQRDMDSSCHRLARIPNKFTVPKTAKIEQPESYAISYFNNNPDVSLDKRSPIEKLEEINSKFENDELDDNDRFNYLVQRKSLTFLAYGENSPECFEALRDLGNFYNRLNRPESALRHLSKAQQISKAVEISDEDCLSLAIELAEAHLSSKATTKSENSKQLNSAENALSPYVDVHVEDRMLAYKRDLLLARTKSRRKRYEEAIEMYNSAIVSLDSANDGRKNANTASLYLEIGECAEAADDMKTASKMYRKAYDTFTELNMVDSAKLVESKIPPNYQPGEEEEEANEHDTLRSITESSIQPPSTPQKQSPILTPKSGKLESSTSVKSSSSSSSSSSSARVPQAEDEPEKEPNAVAVQEEKEEEEVIDHPNAEQKDGADSGKADD